MTKELSYTKALEELQQIIHDLENELVSMDELSAKVKRAAELLDYCKSRLKQTEADLDGHD